MLKRFYCLILLVCLTLCGCSKKEPELVDTLSEIKQKDVITIGVKIDTPPFGYVDKQGQNIGFDVDLAKLIAKNILGDENKINFIPVNTANRIMKLASREVDIVVATMSITPQRQQILDFSVPYYTAGQAILVKKDSPITSLMELSNKKVIIVFGSTVEKSLRSAVPHVKVIGYKTYPEAVAALKEDKADAMIADDTILMGFTIKDDSIKILPKRYSQEPYAVALRKDDERLREAIDFEIKNALDKGVIRQLKAKWEIN